MRHQWRHVQPSVRQQVQHRLEVALLGPAHEADGVVQALRFVTRVIAPRAVGTGDLKAQLLVVEVRPRQFQAHDPDQDDAPALAAHLGGLMHRLIAAGGGGDGWRAFSRGLALPKSTSMRSVPAEIRVRVVRSSKWPGARRGQGTSASSVDPSLRFCRICFNQNP